MSHVVCHMSNVWCHMSHVMCHLSLMTTATATDPPPSYYPIMQGRVVCKSPKSKKKFKPKTSLKQTNWTKIVLRRANITPYFIILILRLYCENLARRLDPTETIIVSPSTRGLQSTEKWISKVGTDRLIDRRQTDIADSSLNQPNCQFSEN